MTSMQSLMILNPRPLSYLSLLDEKILLKIFKYLKLYELLQIGELDVNYQRIIGVHIISNRTLDISSVSKHYDPRRAFRHFGEYTTALKIAECDIKYKDPKYTIIEEIFRLINKRCKIDQLKTFEITLDKSKEDHSFNVAPSIFTHIKSLNIKLSCGSRNYDGFVEKLLTSCKELNSLKLNGSHDNWDFLLHPQVQQLQSLCFDNCTIINSIWDDFISIRGRPLKTMEIFGLILDPRSNSSPNDRDLNGRWAPNSLDPILSIQSLAMAFQKLEKLTLSLSRSINLNGLELLPHLKELQLNNMESYGLIYVLTQTKTIEKLSINCERSIKLHEDIQPLIKLRCVEFQEPCESQVPVIKKFLQLSQLIECKLSSKSFKIKIKIISEIVGSSQYLQVLRIDSSKTTIKTKEFASMVSKREKNLPNARPIHLHVRCYTTERHRSDIIIMHKIY